MAAGVARPGGLGVLHAKRDLRSRTRTWLLNPVLAVLVLFALGGAYETIGRATEPSVAMRGELVDVGPYRLHLECTGTGGPTVILEPGGGASAATLGLIAPEVAGHTTVCVYDRAGKGWSDAAQTHPTAHRSRPTSIRCLSGPMCLAPTSSPGTPSEAST